MRVREISAQPPRRRARARTSTGLGWLKPATRQNAILLQGRSERQLALRCPFGPLLVLTSSLPAAWHGPLALMRTSGAVLS